MIKTAVAGVALVMGLAQTVSAQSLLREDFNTDPAARGWASIGDQSLFGWIPEDQRLNVVWDSSKPNSYYHLPIGQSLTPQTPFRLRFRMALGAVAVGTNPGKPYTFQISVGLIRLADATAPGYARGAGIGPENGPRNLVEFTYFPDSGFGATVAPTIVNRDNQYAAAYSYPLELSLGREFEVEMEFLPEAKLLKTRMWRDGEPFGTEPGRTIEDAVLPEGFASFEVDTVVVASYSDEGQTPPEFSGSVLAMGWVDDIELELPAAEAPRVSVAWAGGRALLRFDGRADRIYQLEASVDLVQWEAVGAPKAGVRGPMEIAEEGAASGVRFFRLKVSAP